MAELAALEPDIIILAAYGQILPPSVLALPRCGCVNVHPSLLPRHRGASPVAAAILAGDEFSGVSIMLMDEGLDTGGVLTRAQIPVMDGDTTGSLGARLSVIAAHLLADVLPDWIKGSIEPRPQNDAAATYSGTIGKEDGQINWHRPAVEIWRRVRAYNPWPGSYTRWQGRALKIMQAAPLPAIDGVDTGQVVALPGGGCGIGTSDGVLEVLLVQLEGKRVMTAGEIIRGQPHFVGARLPS